jgi:phage N-6-adenine-methyltransferase
MDLKVMYMSERDDWETPQSFFDELNREFVFTLDVCATNASAKCNRYFTKEQDGLKQDWNNEVVFMNPPYGKEIAKWMKKAYEESFNGATVVCLVHSRTDTRWFHDWVYGKAEIRFVKGRLKFGDGKGTAPFPSMIAIYKPIKERL